MAGGNHFGSGFSLFRTADPALASSDGGERLYSQVSQSPGAPVKAGRGFRPAPSGHLIVVAPIFINGQRYRFIPKERATHG